MLGSGCDLGRGNRLDHRSGLNGGRRRSHGSSDRRDISGGDWGSGDRGGQRGARRRRNLAGGRRGRSLHFPMLFASIDAQGLAKASRRRQATQGRGDVDQLRSTFRKRLFLKP